MDCLEDGYENWKSLLVADLGETEQARRANAILAVSMATANAAAAAPRNAPEPRIRMAESKGLRKVAHQAVTPFPQRPGGRAAAGASPAGSPAAAPYGFLVGHGERGV